MLAPKHGPIDFAGFESRISRNNKSLESPAVILNKLFYERPLKTLTIGKKAGLDIKSTQSF